MRLSFEKVRASSLAAVSAAGTLCMISGAAYAAGPGYCAQYARLAVHEVQVNMATPGCFKGFDNRWHVDYQRHYNWCLGADPAAVAAERD